MDNDELLVLIRDMFDKKTDEMSNMFNKKIEEVKLHTGALVEDLHKDVKTIAEGHNILDKKIDNLQNDLNNTKQELKEEIGGLKKDMSIVKDYVINVDAKLNEHEVILKRV